MAIKRIIGKANKRNRKCLRCGRQTENNLRDNVIHICEHCGQKHYVDVYKDCIALTVVERPDMRNRTRRSKEELEQQKARRELIERAEARRLEQWEDAHREWLEEFAAMTESEQQKEYEYMGEEMAARVKRYIEKRKSV